MRNFTVDGKRKGKMNYEFTVLSKLSYTANLMVLGNLF